MKKLTASALLAFGALTGPAFAATETFVVDKSHSEVSFQVRHIVTKVRGYFKDFEADIQIDKEKPEASSVAFTIKAASIDTANERRDAHLKSGDFFEAEKYPAITFKSTRVAAAGKDRYDVTGVLSLRGVEKVVTLPVTVTGIAKDPRGNEKIGFETSLTVSRKDFGMLWNAALDNGGVVLGDDVTVTFSLETQKPRPPAAAPKAS
jgi:polyisoprenoid-binding protein YceI